MQPTVPKAVVDLTEMVREDAGLVERLRKEHHIRVVWPAEFLEALSPGK